MKGRVKWWNKERGYGFIEYNETSNIFVHLKKEEISRINFNEEEKIEFELEQIDSNVFLKVLDYCEN